MRALLAAILLAGPAQAADLASLKACVKWSKDLPDLQVAGAGLFASTTRVEGSGPYAACDVVAATESFGVGWLMRAYMKQGVFSPCGERLGGYGFSYKGDQWQTKIVAGLHEFLVKNPKALAAAKVCPPAPAPTPVAAPIAAPVELSTAPLTPGLPAEPVIPSTGTK